MKQVTRAEFFDKVGKLDVHPQIQPGPYPYTALWKTPGGMTRGKTVSFWPEKDGKVDQSEVKTDYFLPE